jgi:hypothetical protein
MVVEVLHHNSSVEISVFAQVDDGFGTGSIAET